jgi:hypothetical protein
MKALAFFLLSAGILIGSMSGASAQQAAATTDSAAAAATDATTSTAEAIGGSVLTPEQLENLNAMVEQMRTNMDQMVQAVRDTALQIGGNSKTVVLTTTDLAAIAIGSVGGALVIDLLGGGGMATLAGAVVGGVGAHWLMTNQSMPSLSME